MAIVIDGLKLVNLKKRLPKEAFFVDTNVVIDYVDPFGRSFEDDVRAARNRDVTQVIGSLKRTAQAHSTIGVIAEYYKHIQVGFYRSDPDRKHFDPERFKELRDNDPDFMNRWDFWMEEIKKTFRKKFPVYSTSPDALEVLDSFRGGEADFGDHLLFKAIMAAPAGMWCVFSNDGDFFSFSDDLYLLTTNEKIIKTAYEEGKLYKAADK